MLESVYLRDGDYCRLHTFDLKAKRPAWGRQKGLMFLKVGDFSHMNWHGIQAESPWGCAKDIGLPPEVGLGLIENHHGH